jgi:uncharacterized membrane protein HdeD (DUF308 family)
MKKHPPEFCVFCFPFSFSGVSMKYAFLSAVISLVLYYDGLTVPAGILGYFAGISFLITYREQTVVLAIVCIAAAILSVMYFPLSFSLQGYLNVGSAWSVTIGAFFFIFAVKGLIDKYFRK